MNIFSGYKKSRCEKKDCEENINIIWFHIHGEINNAWGYKTEFEKQVI